MNFKERRALEKEEKRRKKQLQKMLQLQPRKAQEYFVRGVEFSQLQKYKYALSDFNKAIQLNPKYAEAYNNRGNVYAELKQYEEALRDYDQVIQLNPKYAEVYNNRGTLYAKLKQYEEALKDFNQAIQLNPKSAEVYNNRGLLYFNLKQYEEALKNYEQAIQLNPQFAETYVNRGLLYFNLKQYEEALKDFNQAIQFNPQFADAYVNRGNLYSELKQYEEALKDYDHAIQLNPKYAEVYNNRGTIYVKTQKHEEALKNFNRAIQLNFNSSIFYKNRALFHIKQANYTKAQTDFDHAIELSTSLEEKQTFYFIAYSSFLAAQRFEEARNQVENFFKSAGLQENLHKHVYLDNISRAEEIYQKNQKLTEQYRAEVEESRKFKYLSSMATAVAHQINQPVGIIRAATSAALSDIQDELFQPTEELKPLLNKIYAQTGRLRNIIDSFRSFARGDRQHRERVNLNQVIAQTLALFEAQFQHHNIKLTREETHSKLTVWANPFQLAEVLINLLNNAKDALEGSANPQVWVKTRREPTTGQIEIQIEDNGPGIAPEFLEKLFMPFESTKPTERGTGLGLHLSRQIIQAFGGQLNYIPRPGGGAAFQITLPPFSESEELNNG